MKLRSIALNLTALALAAGLAACSDNEETVSLSGSGIKGPIKGATVTVYSLENASSPSNVNATCTSTTNSGSYTCDIPSAAKGPFKVELTGGQYCSNEKTVDECVAPATVKNVGSEKLSTIVTSSNGNLNSAPITPFTTAAVAAAVAAGTPSSFVTKYQTLANNLGIDANPTVAPASDTASNIQLLLSAISSSSATISDVVSAVKDLAASSSPVSTNSTSLTIGSVSLTLSTVLGSADSTTAGTISVPTDTGATTGASTGGTTLTGATQ